MTASSRRAARLSNMFMEISVLRELWCPGCQVESSSGLVVQSAYAVTNEEQRTRLYGNGQYAAPAHTYLRFSMQLTRNSSTSRLARRAPY